jgi:FAD/FMN-containing dehydrogenase
MGWLTRKAGLTIDSLVGAEMVTADGRILRVSQQENPELFWALRGGGGNFGVVTSFEYRLHEVGPLCQLGFFFWTADRGVEALRFIRDYVRGLSEDFAPVATGLAAPPAPFVPEAMHGRLGWALMVAGFGDPQAHAQAVEPVKASSPDVEFVTPIPYVMLQQLANEGNEHGLLGYEKAHYMDDLADGAIDILAAAITTKASPLSGIPIFVFGGAYARVPEEATAFAGSRRALYAVNLAGQAAAGDMGLYEADRAWVRSVWQDLVPYSSGAGGYVNFMSEYEEDRVRQAYGAKYERLQRVKREYDPDNVFHRMAANIKPG